MFESSLRRYVFWDDELDAELEALQQEQFDASMSGIVSVMHR